MQRVGPDGRFAPTNGGDGDDGPPIDWGSRQGEKTGSDDGEERRDGESVPGLSYLDPTARGVSA